MGGLKEGKVEGGRWWEGGYGVELVVANEWGREDEVHGMGKGRGNEEMPLFTQRVFSFGESGPGKGWHGGVEFDEFAGFAVGREAGT